MKIPIPNTDLVLEIADPRIDTPEVRAWLTDCAQKIGEEIASGRVRQQALFGAIAAYVRPARA